jgi:hypothetical protein
VREAPEDLRGLMVLHHELRERARNIMETTSPDDGGAWYKANNLADAIKLIIDDTLRERWKLGSRYYFEYCGDFKISHNVL